MKNILIIFILFVNITFSQNNDSTLINRYKKIISTNYSDYNNVNELIVKYKDSLANCTDIENKSQIGYYNKVLSRLYYNLGDYHKCIDFNKQALKYFKASKDTIFIKYSLLSISAYYGEINEEDIAIEYLKELEDYAVVTNDSNALARIYINMAMAYSASDYDTALFYLNKADSIIGSSNNISANMLLNNTKATIYYNAKNYQKSVAYYLKASQYIDTSSMYYAVMNSNIAEVYMKLNEPDSALKYSTLAANTNKKLQPVVDYSNTYSVLTDIYLNKNNVEKATKYFHLYRQYIDTVILNKKIEYISKLKVLHQTEALIESNKNKSEKLKKYRKRIIWLIVGIVSLLIISTIFYMFYKKLNKSYRNIIKESVKLNKIKEENIYLKQKLLKEEKQEKKSAINIDNSDEIFKEIIRLLEDEELYKDKDFSINKLSEILKINRSYISNIINSKTNNTFTKLVNQYRVEEAKRLLLSDKHKNITLTGIGELAGFKSESSFYRVFKSELGMTPLFFIKNMSK